MENEHNVKVLDKLIRINSEKIKGFTNILDELTSDSGNGDLYPIFNKIIMDSQRFIRELSSEAIRVDMTHPVNTPIDEDERLLDRMWIILKDVFNDGNRQHIAREFERIDSTLIKEYQDCLNDETLTKDQIILIKDHIDHMIFTHNLIVDKIRTPTQIIDKPKNVISEELEEPIFD